ncbi:tetraacyldisaccharide 4'-kinase [Gemmatimonadota bacterium]
MRTALERTLQRIWTGRRPRSLTAPLYLFYFLLIPFSVLYSSLVWARRWLTQVGLLRCRRLSGVRVVSVGNITVGGTGKSPLTAGLAATFQMQEVPVAVISRGYGALKRGSGPLLVSDGSGPLAAPDKAGDEPVMIAGAVPVPVIVSRDRYVGARLARDRYGAEVVILDDGFQHLGLARDLNIVLLEAADPFGNGWTLPAGKLREPLSALKAADMFILVHRGGEIEPVPDRLKGLLKAFSRNAMIIDGLIGIRGVRRFGVREEEDLSSMAGRNVILVSGIGTPRYLEEEVTAAGMTVVEHLAYRDHHRYDEKDVERIGARFLASGAELLVSTAKDETKLIRAGLGDVVEEAWVAEVSFESRFLEHIAGVLS